MMQRKRPPRRLDRRPPSARRQIERQLLGRLLRCRSLGVLIIALIAAVAWEGGLWRLVGEDRTAVAQQATGSTGQRFRGRITRILDGDTFWMDSAPSA